jgi:hypothetical protein
MQVSSWIGTPRAAMELVRRKGSARRTGKQGGSMMTFIQLAAFKTVGIIIGANLALAAGLCPSSATSRTAVPTLDFLDSIGVVSTFPDRGQPLVETIGMIRYCGFRWVRAGIEGLSDDGPTTIRTFLDLHRETGVKFSWGLLSGGTDLDLLLDTGRVLAEAGALLAFEGNNEPNNWGVAYKGEKGGHDGSWMAVAKLQRDLYSAVKADPTLARYPVWSISEPGAERDNVGLQFLEIPSGARTLMPAGTGYADYANVHNYIYHPHSPYPADNKVWDAADPTAASRVDGLFGNFGVTWAEGFRGYRQGQLDTLPRVTTETGTNIEGRITEALQGVNLLNVYLAQFKRGYAYTSVYLLRDRTDEEGNQTFGFFRPDYSPRKAAFYLHNLTAILADSGTPGAPGQLDYAIENQPRTVHDLLLQRSDGVFQLVIWGERLVGEDRVTVRLGAHKPSVRIYDPTKGVGPIQSLTDTDAVDLLLSDHPVVIEVRPGSR